jgi:hypothetical protein
MHASTRGLHGFYWHRDMLASGRRQLGATKYRASTIADIIPTNPFTLYWQLALLLLAKCPMSVYYF